MSALERQKILLKKTINKAKRDEGVQSLSQSEEQILFHKSVSKRRCVICYKTGHHKYLCKLLKPIMVNFLYQKTTPIQEMNCQNF